MAFWNQKKKRLKRLKNWIRGFFKHYMGGIYNRADEYHLFLTAGGLAFSLIICIVPMVLIIFAGLGMVLEQPSITDEINTFIDNVIPYQKYADSIKEIVVNRINEFRLYRGIAGIAGIFGLLFASSGLFSSMRTILHQTFDLNPDSSVVIGKLRDFGMIFLVMFYFLLSILILPGLDIFSSMVRNLEALDVLGIDVIVSYLLELVSFGIIFLAFFVLYLTVPQVRLPMKVITVSAIWAALLWEIAKQGFGLYITEMATYKRIYGAYALLIVVIFWIYYSSIVFVVSGHIGQLYRERAKL